MRDLSQLTYQGAIHDRVARCERPLSAKSGRSQVAANGQKLTVVDGCE